MNQTFQNELSEVITKFPDLSIRQINGQDILKGILDICDESSSVTGSFSVEIHSTEKFPYRFPKIFEVGGEIPCNADWHKYADNLCCLTVEQDEILICRRGVSLLYFIEKMAIPYFANQLYRQKTGHYLNEYPHGKDGVKLFYAELIKSNDVKFWHSCYEHAFLNTRTGRNEKCYCNSGAKYKKCHLPVEKKLHIIGKQKVLDDINWITA
ncbi:MAG: SEC-C domain-containing protein [Bacteroidales bacterium]|nr:SEC-C domain-containing protein [Bacteroidales bacterium]